MYFLMTERLGFRTWRRDDFDLARSLWGDPAVTQLIDARAALSDDDVRERLEREMAMQRHHGVQYWPMFLLATGELVGCCGLRPYGDDLAIRELGVHVRSDFWRQGFAEEATRRVIEHAFGDLGLTTLFAGHHPKNESSRRLLEKLGFRHVRDELYPPTGLMHPSYELNVE